MNTLDPEVRDLLTAIYCALLRPEHSSYEGAAVRTAIEGMMRFPSVYQVAWATRWLTTDACERADARRCRRADRNELYELNRASEGRPA